MIVWQQEKCRLGVAFEALASRCNARCVLLAWAGKRRDSNWTRNGTIEEMRVGQSDGDYFEIQDCAVRSRAVVGLLVSERSDLLGADVRWMF